MIGVGSDKKQFAKSGAFWKGAQNHPGKHLLHPWYIKMPIIMNGCLVDHHQHRPPPPSIHHHRHNLHHPRHDHDPHNHEVTTCCWIRIGGWVVPIKTPLHARPRFVQFVHATSLLNTSCQKIFGFSSKHQLLEKSNFLICCSLNTICYKKIIGDVHIC